MVLQQADAVRRKNRRKILVEDPVENQGEDEAEEAFSGLGVIVEGGLELDQGLCLGSDAGGEEGEGLW